MSIAIPCPRRRPLRKLFTAGLLPLMAVACAAPMARADTGSNLEIIARGTDPVFGGNDETQARLENAFLNNAGDVAFELNLVDLSGGSDFDADAIYRYTSGLLVEELRAGGFGTGGDTLEDVRLQGLSDNGSALSRADVFPTGSTDPIQALFLSDGGSVTELFREGDPNPAGGTFGAPLAALINAQGETAFQTSPPSTFLPDAVIRADAGGVEALASIGDGVPGKTGVTFEFFTGFVPISNAGHVGFTANLTGTGITDHLNDQGFYVVDPAGNIAEYSRVGAPAPNKPGSTIAAIGTRVPVNSNGDAVLSLFYRNVLGDFSTGGLFLANGSSLTPILLGGQSAPGIGGQFLDFTGVPTLNDAGTVAVQAFLTDDTSAGNRIGSAIFAGDENGLTPILRTGDPLPDGQAGVFSALGNGDDGEVALNEEGQIVFLAAIDLQDGGTEFDTFGLFFYDPEAGLGTIAVQGQDFDGDTLAAIRFRDNAGALNDAASGLNDFGQVAFQYSLENGETGIALYNIPEPTTATLFAACLAGLATRRPRRRR